jgi:hypothetical protein
LQLAKLNPRHVSYPLVDNAETAEHGIHVVLRPDEHGKHEPAASQGDHGLASVAGCS